VTAVADSSPLVILTKLGCLDFLNRVFPRVYISNEVHYEVVVAGAGLPGASEVSHVTRTAFGIPSQLSSYLLAFPSSACQFSWGIRACELRRSTTRPGFVRAKSSWRPMFGVLGRLLNRNDGHTAGTRKSTRV
jgi:hypothetical protein